MAYSVSLISNFNFLSVSIALSSLLVYKHAPITRAPPQMQRPAPESITIATTALVTSFGDPPVYAAASITASDKVSSTADSYSGH